MDRALLACAALAAALALAEPARGDGGMPSKDGGGKAGPAARSPDARPAAPDAQRPPAVAPPPPPGALSAEDAALVRQLALLENVELLRHLELFEREPAKDANPGSRRP